MNLNMHTHSSASRVSGSTGARIVHAAALLCLAVVVGACGGGGDAAGIPPPFGGEVPPTEGGASGAPVASNLSLTLSSTSLANTGSGTLKATVTAVDVNGNTVAEIPVTVQVNNDAVATVSGPTTNALGVVEADIGVGANQANRVVTVTAISGSLSRTATFQVVGANLVATPLPAVIVPGAPGQVDFRLLDANSNPMVGQTILVSGVSAVEVSGVTGSNGDYSYTYTAPAAGGNLDIKASAGGVSTTQTVLVQSGSGTIPPAQLAVQSASVAANPSVVSVNTATTSNRSEIRALFLGANNAPVKNVRVRFDLAGDPNSIGGSFTSGTNVVYSDVNGVATAAYVPGSRFSPTDGVTVRACWSNNDFAANACPNQTVTTLTVISEALSVSIGSNALIEVGPSGLDYIKRYLVQVNDSSGLAKAGVQISPSIDLVRYFKGEWVVVGDKWAKAQLASCDNEDLNRNGVMQVYANGAVEDANGTGKLEPRKADVNISFVGSSTTNSDGQVVLKITYPQSMASWLEFNILVAASGVAGTEGRTSFQGVLPVLADAISDADVEPAFRLGPYGVQGSPTVLTVNPEGQQGLLCTNKN